MESRPLIDNPVIQLEIIAQWIDNGYRTLPVAIAAAKRIEKKLIELFRMKVAMETLEPLVPTDPTQVISQIWYARSSDPAFGIYGKDGTLQRSELFKLFNRKYFYFTC